jgi:hypothetical protein
LRLPAVVVCFVSTFILLSQLFLVVCVSVQPLLLALPQLFLLFFFLSHAVCCPSCLRRLSSTAVTCFASTLPPLLLSRTRSRAVCASHFFRCCWIFNLLSSSSSRVKNCPAVCRPDFSFSTSFSLTAICVRLFCLLCFVLSPVPTLSSVSCARRRSGRRCCLLAFSTPPLPPLPPLLPSVKRLFCWMLLARFLSSSSPLAVVLELTAFSVVACLVSPSCSFRFLFFS